MHPGSAARSIRQTSCSDRCRAALALPRDGSGRQTLGAQVQKFLAHPRVAIRAGSGLRTTPMCPGTPSSPALLRRRFVRVAEVFVMIRRDASRPPLCTRAQEPQHRALTLGAVLAGVAPHPSPQNLGLRQARLFRQSIKQGAVVTREVDLNGLTHNTRLWLLVAGGGWAGHRRQYTQRSTCTPVHVRWPSQPH